MAPFQELFVGIDGPSAMSVPGATTIRTSDLVRLIEHQPLLIDDCVGSWGRSLPGAIGLQGAGFAAALSGDRRRCFIQTMIRLTQGNPKLPIVVFSVNPERLTACNLIFRLVEFGYTSVYWYRGGFEAWKANQLPDSELKVLKW
jgi:hypothetical protein